MFNYTPAFAHEQVASNLLSAMAQSPFPVTQLRPLGPRECARQFPVIAPVIYATADILLPGSNQTTTVASSQPWRNPRLEWTTQSSSVSLPYRGYDMQTLPIQQQATRFSPELSPASVAQISEQTSTRTSALTVPSAVRSGKFYNYGPRDQPAEDTDPFLVNLAKFKNAKTPEEREAVKREMVDFQNRTGARIDERMENVLIRSRGQQAERGDTQEDVERQRRRENLQEDVLRLTDQRNLFMAGVDKLRERDGSNSVSDLQQIVEPMRSIVRQSYGDSLVDQLDSFLKDEAEKERTRNANDPRGNDTDTHARQSIRRELVASDQIVDIREYSSIKGKSLEALKEQDVCNVTNVSVHIRRLQECRFMGNWEKSNYIFSSLDLEESVNPKVGIEIGWNLYLQGYVRMALGVIESSYIPRTDSSQNITAYNTLLMMQSYFAFLCGSTLKNGLNAVISIQEVDKFTFTNEFSNVMVASNYFYCKILIAAIWEGLLNAAECKVAVQLRLQIISETLLQAGHTHESILFAILLSNELESTQEQMQLWKQHLRDPRFSASDPTATTGGNSPEIRQMQQIAKDFEALGSPALQITALSLAVAEGADVLPWADMVDTFSHLERVLDQTSNRYAMLRLGVEFSAAAILRQEHLGKTFEYLQKSVDDAWEETPKTTGQLFMQLGQAYGSLGDQDRSLKYVKMAVQMFEKWRLPGMLSDAKLALATAMTSETPGPNHKAAIEILKESLRLDEKRNDVQRQLKKLEAIVSLEGCLARADQGDRHKELQNYWMGESERIGESLFLSFGSSLLPEDNHSQVRAAVDQAAAALAAYRELGPYSVPLEFILHVSQALKSLGQNQDGQERNMLYAEALRYLEIGESISERLRRDLCSSSGLESLRQKQLLVASSTHDDIFNHALALTFALGDAEKMWRWTQRAKARALSDLVGLQLDLYTRQRPPNFAVDDQIVKLLEEEARLISTSMELERVRSMMEERPRLGRLLASRAGKTDLQDLQWLFGNGKDRDILPGSKVVLVDWVIIGDKIVMVTLDARLEPQMSVLDIALTHVRVWKQRYLSSHTPLVSSERLLEEGTLDKLNCLVSRLSQCTHEGDLLIFCPTRTLNAIPLHALKIEGVPVIWRNPVVYTASVSLLRQCCERANSKLHERAGGLRTAFFSAYEDHTEDKVKITQREEAYKCIRKLASDFGSEPRLGCNANRENLTTVVKDVDIFHFHGHTATHPNIIYQSLVLSDGKTSETSSGVQEFHHTQSSTSPYRPTLGPHKDAFTVRDAFSLNLNLSLASIVACSPGVQKYGTGDEPQGLLSAL
ncbi:hypothetical protein DER46DRAFT_681210 [Fusarium sp. MPI-SDFR-AT-0072]|nr:hypothetical protein DER46DRAFT_681210 [Fusarium sp. MPI-SDFR-AT-0072]